MHDPNKEFKPSSWSINNRTAVFVLTFLLGIAGLITYNCPTGNGSRIGRPRSLECDGLPRGDGYIGGGTGDGSGRWNIRRRGGHLHKLRDRLHGFRVTSVYLLKTELCAVWLRDPAETAGQAQPKRIATRTSNVAYAVLLALLSLLVRRPLFGHLNTLVVARTNRSCG